MYNILVCDDEKEITDAVEIYLTQEGYQVFKAYDGNQAIELLKKEQIHLLIIDLMMPGMDGIHAIPASRSLFSRQSHRMRIRSWALTSARMIM